MGRYLWWMALPAIAAACLCLLDFGCVSICDGGCDVDLIVRSEAQRPIASTCAALAEGDAEWEESLLAYLRKTAEGERFLYRNKVKIEPFDGRPFPIGVPVTERLSCVFSRQLSYWQARDLILVVQYQDGKREAMLLKLPDIRESRTLTIDVP